MIAESDVRIAGPPTALRVRLEPGVRPTVRTRARPVATAHSLLLQAVSGTGGLMPAGLRRSIALTIDEVGRQAYRPIVARGQEFYPDVILSELPDTPAWVSQYAMSVGDADPSIVVDQLLAHYGGKPPPRWLPVLTRPKPWLHALSTAITASEPILEALWSSARTRIEIESFRIDQLLLAGGPGALLNNLSPRVSFADGEVRLTYGHDIDIPITGDIQLVPLVAGPRAYLLYGRRNDIHLGYPMPGAFDAALGSPTEPPTADRLAAVLGEARARVVRMLDTPRTVGDLALQLESAASTVSYHCVGLQAAGLIESIRVGRFVWIVRTPLGTQLRDLMSGRPSSQSQP